MTTSLLPLLDILANPASPGFAIAATRLGTVLESFNPASLTESERLALQAKLALAITNIREAQALTAAELGLTQKRAQAVQSYNRLK